MFKVAVLMPCYNSTEMLVSQIASIKAQSNVDVTIFAYDDGSTNNTRKILEKNLNPQKDLILNRDSATGSASGSFFFLMSEVFLSDGFDFFALSDHDDFWGPYKLISAIDDMTINKCEGFSSGFLSVSYGRKYGIGRSVFCKKVGKRSKKFDFLFEGPGAGCTFVLTRRFAAEFHEHLLSIGSHTESIFWHDWYIYFFARTRKLSWHISDESHLFYCQHRTNVTGSNVGFEAALKRIEQMRSGWYFSQVLIMARLTKCDLEVIGHLQQMNWRNRLWLARRCLLFRSSITHGIILGIMFLLCSPRFQPELESS